LWRLWKKFALLHSDWSVFCQIFLNVAAILSQRPQKYADFEVNSTLLRDAANLDMKISIFRYANQSFGTLKIFG
jgi:hypothetical protein